QEGPDEAGEGRAPKLEGKTPITLSMHGLVEEPQSCPAEEEGGTPIPTSGLLQVAERRQPLSSVSSLEVHFDLLDLTELTDMSDQELAEVFADSDEENVAREPTAGKSPLPPCVSVLALGGCPLLPLALPDPPDPPVIKGGNWKDSFLRPLTRAPPYH
uniref:Dysbindin domain-containing protein 1 n=1 Tax=Laticauda laticaudata TaxID=8630 RepID=A0A8C5S5I7_LATLA